MRPCAIIAEYNPFHKGHAYQVEETRKNGATHVIALMSGNFVQRGAPALFDKYRRAHMAVLGGVDLVLELPSVYALSSAEFFARGSIDILNSLHGIAMLSFGSEAGDLGTLSRIAEIVSEEPDDYRVLLRKHLDLGQSFPGARSKALEAMLPDIPPGVLSSPNNILGVEYLKALRKTASSIEPFTIRRQGAGYHEEDLEKSLPSATGIRKLLLEGGTAEGLLPESSGDELAGLVSSGYSMVTLESCRDLLLYRLTVDGDRLSSLPDAAGGLAERMAAHSHLIGSVGVIGFIEAVKTRRYTHTRISRILMQFLLSFDRCDLDSLRRGAPGSVKILESTPRGNEFLASIRKDTEIKLIHNFGKETDEYHTLDSKASKVYGLLCRDYDDSWDFKGYI